VPTASNSSLRAHLLVACVAGVWGTLGRFALDWYLRFAGFNEIPSQPALTFVIGSVPVWAAVAVGVWTPFTGALGRASVRGSLLLGGLVAMLGTLILYGLFVIHMGLPTSLVEVVNVCLFFPLFLATALMTGGVIALPATVGTAVLLHSLLHAMQGDEGQSQNPYGLRKPRAEPLSGLRCQSTTKVPSRGAGNPARKKRRGV